MRRKTILIAGAVALLALSAVATALAAGSASSSRSSRHLAHSTRRSTQSPTGPPGGGPWGPGGGPGGPGVVHSESVVLDKAGTGFITQTTDRGTVKSVDAAAGQLTIVEAVRSVTYKTVTLTIPSGASVTLDGKSSSLSSLTEGDHVTVISSSEGTTVLAGDSSFHPEGGPANGTGGPPEGYPPPAAA